MPAPLLLKCLFYVSTSKSIACKQSRRHPQTGGYFTVTLASVAVSSVTSESWSQRQRREKCKRSLDEMMWLSSHMAGTMAALWLLTGGPLKFTNILYKAAKCLCTDSSSPEHCSVCTCMLTRRQRLPSTERKAAENMRTHTNTHLIYNLLKKFEKCWSGGEYRARSLYRVSYRISVGLIAKWAGSCSCAEKQKRVCQWKQNEWHFSKHGGYHPRCNCASQDMSCLQAHEFLNGKYSPPTKSPPVLLVVLQSARLSFST